MKTYAIQIKEAGVTVGFITVKASNALLAIDQVIGGLAISPRNEYIARRIT